MKPLWLMVMCTMISGGQAQMTVDDSISLQSYNHRMSLKMKKESQIKRLVRITPESLEKTVQRNCKEKAVSKRLLHKGQLLFYRVYTEKCVVDINVLDGAVISKKNHKYSKGKEK